MCERRTPLPREQVVEPVPDIDRLLSRMDVVIAPSLWLEAWGMVVTEGEVASISPMESSLRFSVDRQPSITWTCFTFSPQNPAHDCPYLPSHAEGPADRRQRRRRPAGSGAGAQRRRRRGADLHTNQPEDACAGMEQALVPAPAGERAREGGCQQLSSALRPLRMLDWHPASPLTGKI